MRRSLPTLAALAAVGAAAPTLAEPPAFLPSSVRPAPPGVAELVRQLGSPRHAERDAAGRQLLGLGEGAIPALDAALLRSRDPETRQRLEGAVHRLKRDRLDAPKFVTLDATDIPLTRALAELSRQSGYAIRADALGPDGARRHTFRLTNVPFWEALDAVCAAGGFTPLPSDDTGQIGVYSSDTFSPFVAYAGPFRVLATGIQSSRHVQLSGLSRARPVGRYPETLTLHFQIASEPRWPILAAGAPELVEATDAAGAALRAPAEAGVGQSFSLPSSYYRAHSAGVTLALSRDHAGAGEIARLRARVPLTVLAESRPDAVVPDVLTPQAAPVAGRAVELAVAEVSRRAGELRLTVTVSRKPGANPTPRWNANVAQRLEVTGAGGARWTLGAVEDQRVTPDGATLSVQFLAPPGADAAQVGPLKLVLNEWVPATKTLEFELKGLPLP